ncbi:response regulator [Massilia dura]|uniref:Response regulator n=1 Tax=Pseudoduganella dura TaxID=321982 RepID=A0A6I3XDD4_9BURK|nr:response regulator transcription factor [Pseudoduganella dura]MUI14509.1 response regulator [Pseudoduganella dura]
METPHFRKTLLVEDQGLTRQAMKTLLIQCDPLLEVDEAGDFAGCTAALAARQYDLLFLDYQLGTGGCGLDVLHWIAERDMPIHVVMLSGQDDRETVMECIKAGASGFISKRSDEGDAVFRSALDTILRGQIYLPHTAMGKGGFSPQARLPMATLEGLALSPRLAEALGYLCQGLSNKGIARKMGLTENTVKEYSGDLLEKFGVRRRTELIVEMARRGIVIPRS